MIRGRQVTTIAKCRYDAEFSGGEYLEQSVVVSDNLVCCQGKKDIAPWMKIVYRRLGEIRQRSNDVIARSPLAGPPRGPGA